MIHSGGTGVTSSYSTVARAVMQVRGLWERTGAASTGTPSSPHLILFRHGGLDLRFLAGPPFSIKVIVSNKKLGDVDSPTVGTVRSSSEMRKLTPRPHRRQ